MDDVTAVPTISVSGMRMAPRSTSPRNSLASLASLASLSSLSSLDFIDASTDFVEQELVHPYEFSEGQVSRG